MEDTPVCHRFKGSMEIYMGRHLLMGRGVLGPCTRSRRLARSRRYIGLMEL